MDTHKSMIPRETYIKEYEAMYGDRIHTDGEVVPVDPVFQPTMHLPSELMRAEMHQPWGLHNFMTVGHAFEKIFDLSAEEQELLTRYQREKAQEIPVKYAGQLEYSIPSNFEHLIPLISKIANYDRAVFGRHESDYMYVTYDQDDVAKDDIQRGGGLHVDGFQSHRVEPKLPIDRYYFVTSSDPPEYMPYGFDLRDLDTRTDDAFGEFRKQADEYIMQPVRVGAMAVYLFSAYCVHQVVPVEEDVRRSILRVGFSARQYDRKGYTPNPMMETGWDYRDFSMRQKFIDAGAPS